MADVISDSLAAALQPFLGTWRLDPAQSHYEVGSPPRDGAYTLRYDGARLHFTIEWTGADGATMRQEIDAVIEAVALAREPDEPGCVRWLVAEGLRDLDHFPTPDEAPDFYTDFGETGPYEAVIGDSECAT